MKNKLSNLLLKPATEGKIFQNVSPQSANWKFVGFEVHDLDKDQVISKTDIVNEFCIVLLSGKIEIKVNNTDYGLLNGRNSVFDNISPYAIYIPMNSSWKISAKSFSEVAICSAPGIKGMHKERIIRPDQMSREIRGKGSNTRYICNILPETEPADSLLVVEVMTPSGNWSSYPPHKHDQDNLPSESYLEETYYHRIKPKQGYIMQRVYTDDKSLNESIIAEDRDVVLVPRGYHPVGVPYGYDSYYLNVMAGPKRTWKFHNDPNHEWIFGK